MVTIYRNDGSVLASLEASSLRDAIDLLVARRTNLYNADLEGADLRGANLSHANLSNADLSGTNLEDANLTGAILERP